MKFLSIASLKSQHLDIATGFSTKKYIDSRSPATGRDQSSAPAPHPTVSAQVVKQYLKYFQCNNSLIGIWVPTSQRNKFYIFVDELWSRIFSRINLCACFIGFHRITFVVSRSWSKSISMMRNSRSHEPCCDDVNSSSP